MLISGCSKSRNQEIIEEHKDQFLTLAEFTCEGIQSEHYILADIDNIIFCESTNDTISSQIHLGNNFTTTGPSTDSTTIVEGSSFFTVWFGVFRDFGLNLRWQHLSFETDPYPDTTTLNDIASETFIEGKVWPISGTNVSERAISCIFQSSDGRQGYNTYHEVSSEFGDQVDKYLTMDKVIISKDEDFIIYDIEMTFDADLHIDSSRYGSTNLWGEVRNGEMKAQFKIPK
jgi:hypothetical protein